jgi:acetyl-CoA carboxylase biotin carboxyl carrier protein
LAEREIPTSDADSRAVIARLSADTLPRLIERLTKSNLGELEVREDGWRIRLRRPMEPISSNRSATADQPRSTHATGGGQHHERTSATHRAAHSQRGDTARGTVTSPAVGYFISGGERVAVGSPIRRGDVVGHVDMLGVRQEVVAPVDGVVREIDVEAGQAVEYGQRLARIEQDSSQSKAPA